MNEMDKLCKNCKYSYVRWFTNMMDIRRSKTYCSEHWNRMVSMNYTCRLFEEKDKKSHE